MQAHVRRIVWAGALLGASVHAFACSRPAPRARRVEIKNFLFVPAALVVASGDTVVWTNTDFVPHTTTARDSAWDSKQIDGNGTWRWVASKPGRHAYYCLFHPNMQGTIEIK